VGTIEAVRLCSGAMMYTMSFDLVPHMLASLGSLEPWLELLGKIVGVLYDWGVYVLANPTQTLTVAVVVLIVLFVAKLILKTVWRIFQYVVLPVLLLWLVYVFLIQPLLA